MIETVDIKNFQSLKNVRFVFGTFNCIIGQSDSGKSAFIRALLACITAKRGFDFVTFGEDHVSIGIGFSDRDAIVWRRTKTTGKYSIRHSGKVQELTKYGHSCPQEVMDIARLGNIDIDEQVSFNPNFSSQFDSLFLLSERGSVIAKILSSVTNANNLLLAVREANLTASRKAGELRVHEELIIEFEEQIRGFDWLEDVGKQIKLIRERVELAKEKRKVIDWLITCRDKIKKDQAILVACSLEIEVLQNILDLCNEALACEEKAKTLAMYKRLYSYSLQRVLLHKEAAASLVVVMQQIEIIAQSDEKSEQLDTLQILQQLERRVVEKHVLYRKVTCDSRSIDVELSEITDEMDEFDVCPLCGNTLGE